VFESNEVLRMPTHIPDLILSKKFTRIYAEIIAETYNNDIFEPKQTRQLTPKRPAGKDAINASLCELRGSRILSKKHSLILSF
jgi:hypothetical protein